MEELQIFMDDLPETFPSAEFDLDSPGNVRVACVSCFTGDCGLHCVRFCNSASLVLLLIATRLVAVFAVDLGTQVPLVLSIL